MLRNLPVWKTAPFLRILIPFIAGIILSAYSNQYIPGLVVLIVLSISLGFCFSYNLFSITAQFRFKTLSGLCIYVSVLCCGYLIHLNSNHKNNAAWFGHHITEQDYLLIKIEEPLQEKPASYKAVSSVHAIINNRGESKMARGKLIAYFKKDSALPLLQYGDMLLLKSNLQLITHYHNPGSFNYAKYSARNNIYHQSFINSSEFHLLGSNEGSIVKRKMYEARAGIIDVIQSNINDKEARGLAEALLIGYKDDLDKDLLMAYTNTGVVHVIAISGLHLGLIYLILSGICKKLPLKNNLIRGIIVISGLWIFSALSGGSPSVLRSAAMFTIIVAGELINRKSFSINALAASAMVLIYYSPEWLWDIGFQLSYAAVLGLICLSAPIYKSLMIYNPILDYLWKMNSVTISATILTLPLTTYYFHQFPLLFLITNSIIVPLSSLILIALIILCSISFINPLAGLLGSITEWIINCMNWLVKYFNEIPATLLTGLQISFIQTILLFILIYLISVYFIKKKTRVFIPALLILLVIFIERAFSFYKAEKQIQLIVYHVNGGNAYEMILGRESFLLMDEKHLSNPDFKMYNLRPAQIKHRIRKVREGNFPERSNLPLLFSMEGNSGENILVVIVRGKPDLSAVKLISNERAVLVIDNSVPKKMAEIIKTSMAAGYKEIFDVGASGAFVKTLQLN